MISFQNRTPMPGRLLLAWALFVSLPAVSHAAPSEAMPRSQVQTILDRLYDDAWAGQTDALEDVLATDSPERVMNAQAMAQEIADLRAAFPAIQYRIQHITVDQDRVLAEVQVSGWQDGPFLGLPPSHRHVSYKTVDCFRVAQGRIVAYWRLTDQLDILRQIGINLTPVTQ